MALPTKPLPVQMTSVTTSNHPEGHHNQVNLDSKPPATITCGNATTPLNLGHQTSMAMTDQPMMSGLLSPQAQNNTKSIQITALIQSNPMPDILGSHHGVIGHQNTVTNMQCNPNNPADFQVSNIGITVPSGGRILM